MSKNTARYYATGRRKTSSARVTIKPGTGTVTVNKRNVTEYMHRPILEMVVRQPFNVIAQLDWDVNVNVRGGGKAGQAEAIRMGISRALCAANPALRSDLKKAGFLTRDDRKVERKKYGRAGARRRFQFSKR
ncbi:MAG: 30S ribosomal protein S9 [Deltaproteobacteria bacterium]|nr:30S ribosomal protein S9 [Deltaproteobacteria bacterium]